MKEKQDLHKHCPDCGFRTDMHVVIALDPDGKTMHGYTLDKQYPSYYCPNYRG